MTPNMMPLTAEVRPNPDYAGECMDPECCRDYYAPLVVGRRGRKVRRGPVPLRNTALADALREKGMVV